MSVPGSGRDKTAEELLAQLLTEREYLAILEYSRAHRLESDDSVFFMVGLLKTFAYAYDQNLATLAAAQEGRRKIENSIDSVIERTETAMTDHAALVKSATGESVRQFGQHIGALNIGIGEMKVLRGLLEATVADAKGAFDALRSLEGNADTPSLAGMFQQRLGAALDKRVPAYDSLFREQLLETISLGMGRYFIIVQVELVALAVIGILVYLLG